MPTEKKQVIAEALLSMLEERELDKITVKDLVERCGISRQTFYYHFQDLMDVVEWIIEQRIQGTLERSLQAEGPRAALRAFVSDAEEHHDLLQRLLSSQRREQVERLAVGAVRAYLWELICRRRTDWRLAPRDQALLLDFYSFGIAGVLLGRCGDRQIGGEELAEGMYRLLSGQTADFPLREEGGGGS